MNTLALLLALAATARLAIVLTRDDFPPTVAFRSWLLARLIDRALPTVRVRPDRPVDTASDIERALAVDKARENPLYVLVTCPWCCSFWIGAPLVTCAYFQPHAWWFLIPTAALTASLAAGVAAHATS